MRRNPKRKPLYERESYYNWYVGVTHIGEPRFFVSKTKPIGAIYKKRFSFVIGPFESKNEAKKLVMKIWPFVPSELREILKKKFKRVF